MKLNEVVRLILSKNKKGMTLIDILGEIYVKLQDEEWVPETDRQRLNITDATRDLLKRLEKRKMVKRTENVGSLPVYKWLN